MQGTCSGLRVRAARLRVSLTAHDEPRGSELFRGIKANGREMVGHASDGVIGYTQIARQLISISHFASRAGKRYDKSCLCTRLRAFLYTSVV